MRKVKTSALCNHPMAGFTLVELVAAMVIIVVLSTLATPPLAQWYSQHQADAQARLLQHYLAKARHNAINSGLRILFCGIDQQHHCKNSDIKNFVVFHDSNRNGQRDADELALLDGAITFNGKVFLRASNKQYISFDPSGYANQKGSIILCPERYRQSTSKRITVNAGGRPYLVKTSRTELTSLREKCSKLLSSGSVDN